MSTPHVSARHTGIAWRLLVPLLLDVVLVVAHWLVADALDRAGLVERLLSPSGLGAIVALLAALALFGLRFAVFFVAPALTLAWWVVVLGDQLAAARAAPDSSPAATPRSRR